MVIEFSTLYCTHITVKYQINWCRAFFHRRLHQALGHHAQNVKVVKIIINYALHTTCILIASIF